MMPSPLQSSPVPSGESSPKDMGRAEESNLAPTWFKRPDNKPGAGADRLDIHGQVEGLVDGLGRTLRSLHDSTISIPAPTTVEQEPANFGWQALLAEVQLAVSKGQVKSDELPDPYRRYTPERLLEIWIEGRPEAEDMVLSHGNPRLGSFFFDGAEFVGAEALGGMCLADRHLDLTILHHEIHTHLGAEAVFRFYEAYGRDPDLLRLDHYLLASFLRGP